MILSLVMRKVRKSYYHKFSIHLLFHEDFLQLSTCLFYPELISSQNFYRFSYTNLLNYKVRIFTYLDVVFQANDFYKIQNTNVL
jgi:hypothetical protein